MSEKKQISMVPDTRGKDVAPGDLIAYAVDQYGSARLKIGRVLEIFEDPGGWGGPTTKIKVKVNGQRVSTIENLYNVVLLSEDEEEDSWGM